MKRIIVALIKWYRRSLSRRKRAPCCRFYPTCSAYALQAVESRGWLVGLLLAGWRILRCNPYGADGIDPVPIHHRTHRASMKASPQYLQGAELLALLAKTKD